jgi:hypothetical protein
MTSRAKAGKATKQAACARRGPSALLEGLVAILTVRPNTGAGDLLRNADVASAPKQIATA